MSERHFEARPATRERVPLLVGLFGASGSGKTFSALRLATGIQRVTGGEIFFIDTEARRALHYADSFKFRHVEFKAPFSPLDYLEAIEFCAKQGAGVVVVDSMSHEHEGPGGVLEWHEEEMRGDQKRNMLAWAKPKAARRRLINTLLQLGINAVFCFRAKEKLKLVTGKDPKELGWMPIAGEEFVYEMTTTALLYPGSGGVPTWNPTLPGEKAMTKLPKQFEATFAKEQPLSEEIGVALARWAAGDATAPGAVELRGVLERIAAQPTRDAVLAIASDLRAQAWTPSQRGEIKQALDARVAALKTTAAPPAQEASGSPREDSTGGAASPFDAKGYCRMCSRHELVVQQQGHEKGCEFEVPA